MLSAYEIDTLKTTPNVDNLFMVCKVFRSVAYFGSQQVFTSHLLPLFKAFEGALPAYLNSEKAPSIKLKSAILAYLKCVALYDTESTAGIDLNCVKYLVGHL